VKVRIDHGPLLDALAWVSSCVPSKPPVPVLGGVKLATKEDRLTLVAFDYEVSAVEHVEALVAETGEVLVSARLLAGIVKELPKGEQVTLAVEGTRLVVTVKGGKFSLPLMPVEDYPQLPELPGKVGEVEAAAWAAETKRVAVAACKDSTLPTLTALSMEWDEQGLTLACTDRFQLATTLLGWQGALGDEAPGKVLLPSGVVKSTALAGSGNLGVHLDSLTSPTVIGFSTGNRRITTRLIDGEFPKWRSLVPTQFHAEIVVIASQLMAVLRRATVLSKEGGRGSRVTLTLGENTLTVTSGTHDDAGGEEVIPVDYTGEPFEIGVNEDFLSAALTSAGSDTVTLSLTTPAKPFLVRPVGDDGEIDPGYTHLVMPVRLATAQAAA
jgi:DNA polymerase III subunit beta